MIINILLNSERSLKRFHVEQFTEFLIGVQPIPQFFLGILFCLFSFTPKETLKNSDFSEFLPNLIKSRVETERNELLTKTMYYENNIRTNRAVS